MISLKKFVLFKRMGQKSNIAHAWKATPTKRNGTARFKNSKQMFWYQHLLLLRDIWWSKFKSIFICSSFFQHQCWLYICGSLSQLFFCIVVYYTLFYCKKFVKKFWEYQPRVLKVFPKILGFWKIWLKKNH